MAGSARHLSYGNYTKAALPVEKRAEGEGMVEQWERSVRSIYVEFDQQL